MTAGDIDSAGQQGHSQEIAFAVDAVDAVAKFLACRVGGAHCGDGRGGGAEGQLLVADSFDQLSTAHVGARRKDAPADGLSLASPPVRVAVGGPGQPFTALGEAFQPKKVTRTVILHRKTIVIDSTGRPRNLRTDEHRAFWAWATVELLRHTGTRIEEMLETSHHSIVQYQLPETGEVTPLLHIAPSKTDVERLLVIDPELADVLSTIIARIRQPDGIVPLVPLYDTSEKVWSAPTPLLFQWVYGGIEASPISVEAIRRAVREILEDTDLLDADGQRLYFVPHDLRRIFTTEAILNGMPPHIAQMLLGHKDINTTMGYKAVYPEEAINGHRAFIARRRTLRPSEEYRIPTDAEWDDFLGHFERRKVALGECGRAYGTSCQHEHSCFSELTDHAHPGVARTHAHADVRMAQTSRCPSRHPVPATGRAIGAAPKAGTGIGCARTAPSHHGRRWRTPRRRLAGVGR